MNTIYSNLWFYTDTLIVLFHEALNGLLMLPTLLAVVIY